MRRSSKSIGEYWRSFERSGEVRYIRMAFGAAAVGLVSLQVITLAQDIFTPDPASGCFNNVADDGALYLTYEEEGINPKKAPESWTMSDDEETCMNHNPFGQTAPVPVVPAP